MKSEVTVRYEDGREQKFPNLECNAVYELSDDTLRYVRHGCKTDELLSLVVAARNALAYIKAGVQARVDRGEKKGGGSEDFVWLDLQAALKPFCDHSAGSFVSDNVTGVKTCSDCGQSVPR